MNRRAALKLFAPALLAAPAWSAVRGDNVMYVGGTVAIPEGVQGELDLSDPKLLRFASKKGSFEMPYDGVTSLEYGQKAGRRLGVALTLTVWALMSKKRKHFLTIGYKDAGGTAQGVVLELPKGRPKSIITVLEMRSGLKCEYESEEARKHVHG
ncbi:MAG: hypothetical protein KJZ79_21195 [Bryobacteraceae bacterium]|nr:hypothetical protein [Bryobacteraceae bacterium]